MFPSLSPRLYIIEARTLPLPHFHPSNNKMNRGPEAVRRRTHALRAQNYHIPVTPRRANEVYALCAKCGWPRARTSLRKLEKEVNNKGLCRY
jgi:hypothetical protein